MDTADTLLQMLQQRQQQGPGLINDYKSALSTAAGQDQQSIDQLRGIYSDPSKFERSKLTSFGLGLMAPTANGRFGEGIANGLAAAVATQDYNQQANLSREEKLAQLQALEARLTRQKAEDTMGVYDKQSSYLQSANADRGMEADLNLEKSDLSPDDAALLADYQSNPGKYRGPEGRALISGAMERASKQGDRQWELKKMAEQSRLDQEKQIAIEQAKAKNKSQTLGNVDKKAYIDAQTQNGAFISAKRVLERAKELGPHTYSGLAPDMRAWMNSNFGIGWNSTDDANAHIEYQRIMQGEAIKQMADTLKGASTDYEMKKYIDMVADPTLPWEAKKPAVERIVAWIDTEAAVNSDLMESLDPENKLYGGDPMKRADPGARQTSKYLTPDGHIDVNKLPANAQQWVQDQIQKGVSEDKIVEVLAKRIQQESGSN